jgi:hypothetical protein
MFNMLALSTVHVYSGLEQMSGQFAVSPLWSKSKDSLFRSRYVCVQLTQQIYRRLSASWYWTKQMPSSSRQKEPCFCHAIA